MLSAIIFILFVFRIFGIISSGSDNEDHVVMELFRFFGCRKVKQVGARVDAAPALLVHQTEPKLLVSMN